VYHKIPPIAGYTRKQVLSFFRIQLSINDKWAIKAICRLFEMQTYNEQKNSISIEDNGVGFTKLDSLRMTPIVRYYLVHKRIRPLDLKYVKAKAKSYAAQIASISDPVKVKNLMDVYFDGEPPLRTRIPAAKQPDCFESVK
jgi:hypothetical protein